MYSILEPVPAPSPLPVVSNISGTQEIIANGARELHNTSTSSGELEEKNNLSSASNLTVIQAQHESSTETAEVTKNSKSVEHFNNDLKLQPSVPSSINEINSGDKIDSGKIVSTKLRNQFTHFHSKLCF